MAGTPVETALAIWRAGVAAVDGFAATARALPDERPDMILAVGKAAGAMTRAACARYGDVPALVVTKDGHGGDLPGHVRLIESAHPVPDARALIAGRALRDAVAGMAKGSTLLLLVSGGASALAEAPVAGKTLNDLIRLNRELLASGVDITAMNARRRELSRIKGGGLLSHFHGANAQVLAISDVPGDDLAVIGSGIGCAPRDPGFDYHADIIASNTVARAAAAQAARAMGVEVLAEEESLHDALPALAARLGDRLRAMPRGALICGGEPSVVLPAHPGRGGRNQALALALASEIAGIEGLGIVVGGTDGSDGPTDAAGGIVDGATWGPGADDALKAADSGTYLDANGALLVTGPTGTNVMDLLVAVRA